MRLVRLGYRDRDRLPLVECVRAMARDHYDVEVDVVHFADNTVYKRALFEGTCDFIIEGLEYLYAEVAGGAEVTMFAAPIAGTYGELVVSSTVHDMSELRGKKIAVRSSGRPDTFYIRLREMGLDPKAAAVLVPDGDVGRWCQWKRVVAGECVGAFISPLYLPAAEEAGLKVLPVPDIPIVGNLAHACLTRFAAENDQLLEDYVKAVIHGICLMKFRPAEALEVVLGARTAPEGAGATEVARRIDVIGRALTTTPFPSDAALANTLEVAVAQYPAAAGVDPWALWDGRWVQRLTDSGFIALLVEEMRK